MGKGFRGRGKRKSYGRIPNTTDKEMFLEKIETMKQEKKFLIS